MEQRLQWVKEFHEKFHVPVLDTPRAIPKDRYKLRHALMKEEVEEYLVGAESGDIENIAKELCDVLYCVYGTILEHGLQDKIDDIFAEVHRSHMSKTYNQYKMIKGDEYFEPDVKKFL